MSALSSPHRRVPSWVRGIRQRWVRGYFAGFFLKTRGMIALVKEGW